MSKQHQRGVNWRYFPRLLSASPVHRTRAGAYSFACNPPVQAGIFSFIAFIAFIVYMLAYPTSLISAIALPGFLKRPPGCATASGAASHAS